MLRLQTRNQFQAVLANHSIARTAHFALHRADIKASPDLQGDSQVVGLGAMVPKRWAKCAVTRNLIKRQIYSLACGYEAKLLAVHHVIRLRATFDRAQFRSPSSEPLKRVLRQELEQLFHQAVVSAAKGLA